ncbi:uncharacterized protein TNCV_74821 [Trichonephila clavipes]|nr:uncharacterized protein TNCV_74821 [Trichonephila clavipes]
MSEAFLLLRGRTEMRSIMEKEKLNSLMLRCTQNDIAMEFAYNDVIKDFVVVKDGITEPRTGPQRPTITSSRENRHVTSVDLMDRAAMSRAPSQELVSFAKQQVSARRFNDVCRSMYSQLGDHGYEFRFGLQHQYGRIHVWRHRGERTLAACIRHRNITPSTGVMVWSAIGYTSQSLLIHIYGTWNSARFISGVLRAEALPFIRAMRNPTF